MQGQETIEAKIREYEHALNIAAGLYLEIQQLVEAKNNDYNLDVAKRLTPVTINFKNTIEQLVRNELGAQFLSIFVLIKFQCSELIKNWIDGIH